MRLIDVDNLVVDARFGEDEIPFVSLKQIEDAPTVAAEPVRYGCWVNDKGLYKCTACNELWTVGWACCIPMEQMLRENSYCPHCGAKMGCEREENETDR